MVVDYVTNFPSSLIFISSSVARYDERRSRMRQVSKILLCTVRMNHSVILMSTNRSGTRCVPPSEASAICHAAMV